MELILKYFTDFTPVQIQQLQALEGLYKEWNEKINVISRKDIDSLYEKHVLHSLSIAAVYDLPAGSTVLDLGAGGGFPGIPLAIFFPHTHFLLVDSIAKKLKVVEAIAAEIGLKNLQTMHSRVEAIHGRKFDYVVSRAVAPLQQLWQWSRPLIAGSPKSSTHQAPAPGLICLKGGDLKEEIRESRTRPHITPVKMLFTEPFFEEKYLLYLPR